MLYIQKKKQVAMIFLSFNIVYVHTCVLISLVLITSISFIYIVTCNLITIYLLEYLNY